MKLETIAIHVPQRRNEGAIAPALHLSTTFEHGPANERLYAHEYIRDANPNVDDLEARLAALEGGDGAVAFGSGMAAATAVLAGLPHGSRVLFHSDLYFDVKALAETRLPGWGLRPESVDLTNRDALERALRDDVALIWCESPANPTMQLLDLTRICEVAATAGAEVLVDSTFAPPVIQRPLALGARYVMHSLTKYMGGHSDVQGGAIIYRGEDAKRDGLTDTRRLTGGVLAPFNAWMIARGLQTLSCRVEKHCANALAVAQMLDSHPAVERARYPFLASNPDSALARRQMTAGGGMLSFDVKGGRARAVEVASKVKLFVNATSFGGPESLIEHRASVEGPGSTTPEALLRLSIGLEHPDDLIADLEQALG